MPSQGGGIIDYAIYCVKGDIMKVCIIGAGNMGTALAFQILKNDNFVNFFSIEEDVVEAINAKHENTKYLPGVNLGESVAAYGDYENALKDVKYIILSVPSNIMELVVKNMLPYLNENHVLINVAKGVCPKTQRPMSLVIKDLVAENIKNNIVSLSGPSIANEIGQDKPTFVVISAENTSLLEGVAKIFTTDTFKVYTNDDKKGVELGGFLKNVVAILAGVCDGLGYGVNTKSALVTRGFKEILMLAEVRGAKQQTLTGLSGLGDLIVTCFSEHSRNRRFGEKLAQGKSVDEAKQEIGQAVEGIIAVKMALEIAKENDLELKLVPEIYNIVYEGKDAKTALADFIKSEKVEEF